jgi:hypothetical protein
LDMECFMELRAIMNSSPARYGKKTKRYRRTFSKMKNAMTRERTGGFILFLFLFGLKNNN